MGNRIYDHQRLIKGLAEQGAEIVDRKDGYTVRFPTGDTMGIHTSPSTQSVVNVLKSIVKRNNMEWPLDKSYSATRRKQRKEETMSIARTNSEGYPAYITEKDPPSESVQHRVREGVKQVGEGAVFVKTLKDITGLADITVAQALYAMGYRWAEFVGKSRRWEHPDRVAQPAQLSIVEDQAVEAGLEALAEQMGGGLVTKSLVDEAVASTKLDGETFSVEAPKTGVPESVKADLDAAAEERRAQREVDRISSDRYSELPNDTRVKAEATPIPPAPKPEPQPEPLPQPTIPVVNENENESENGMDFLDDRDSWVLGEIATSGKTIDEIREAASIFGLDVEVRAWRRK